MGAVVEMVSSERVDEAWAELQAHRKCLIDGGVRPLLDRKWVEEEARLHRRFTKLLQAMDERS